MRIPTYAIVLALLVGVAVIMGATGFLLGRDSAGSETASTSQASTAGDAAVKRTAYRRGVEAGREQAKPRRSFADGVEAGRKHGFAKGYTQGSQAALGGGRFDLAAGSFYVVRFARGDHDALELDRSAQLVPGRAYQLCNATEICYQPAP